MYTWILVLEIWKWGGVKKAAGSVLPPGERLPLGGREERGAPLGECVTPNHRHCQVEVFGPGSQAL